MFAKHIQATSKGSDQTARMRRLFWAFAGRTYHIVGDHMPRFIFQLNGVFITFYFMQISDANSIGMWHKQGFLRSWLDPWG